MNKKTLILISILAVAALALIALAPLAWFFTAGLRTPVVVPSPDYWPTGGWRTSTPEQQGFDSGRLAKGLQSLREKQAPIDSLLIIRNGYLVLDANFATYDGTFPHDLASVTKSITTTLIGIAAAQGRLDPDEPVVSFFPGRTIANLDERKQRMTVRDLVSMRNGMESGCIAGDEPTLDAMRSQPDWIQDALDRPMTAEPGTRNCYDSPGMHILSAILQETSGMTELEFARQNLFEPLGIREVYWESDPQGYTHGWGDLHLLPGDAARIGLLWLQRGKWEGRQIVPEAWVLDSVKAHSKFVQGDFGYGYGWWVSWADYLAVGRGGQKVRVFASRNTVLVVTGSYFEYSDVEKWLLPMLISLKTSRPANPAGQAELARTLSDISQGSVLRVSGPLPDLGRTISGKTYACDDNPVGVTSFSVVFNDPKVAEFSLVRYGQEVLWPVGLDGKYRLSDQGLAQAGYWEDSQTFVLQVFDIGQLTRRFHFDADRLEVSIPEAGLTLECKVQNP